MKLSAMTLGVAVLLGVSSGVAAQTSWPTKPITMIVPYPPGGITDNLARALADRMAGELGQPVIVRNRDGAAGTIGSAELASADPDGYTIGIGNIGSHVMAVVLERTKYDPLTDFTPVGVAIDTYSFLGVRTDLPVETVEEFVEWAKANPDSLSYGTAGYGSFGHFTVELMKLRLGIPGLHVPYKGTNPAALDLMSGRIDFMVDNLTLPAYEGKINVLATAAAERYAAEPDIPTLRELGFDFDITGWQGVFAPAGLPDDIRDKLADAVKAAVETPKFQEMAFNWGGQVNFQGPEAMQNRMEEELEIFREVRRQADIKSDN